MYDLHKLFLKCFATNSAALMQPEHGW